MASTATAESSRPSNPRAKPMSGSGQRIVPVIPLGLGRSPPKKKPANGPPSNASFPPQSTAHQEHGSNGHQAPTLRSSASTGEQAASKSPDTAYDPQAITRGTGNGNALKDDLVEQQPISQQANMSSDTHFEPPQSARLSQIPTQDLPPPFYPSGDHSTPVSAVSSNFSRALHGSNASFNGSSYQTQSSANGIVFGGYADSSSSSPAPPVPSGHIPYPPPPLPNLAQGDLLPPLFAPPNHSHHLSEPHPYAAYPHPANMNPYGPPNIFGRSMFPPPPPLYPATSLQWVQHGKQGPYPMASRDGRLVDGRTPFPDVTRSISRTGSAISSRTQEREQPRISPEPTLGVENPFNGTGEVETNNSRPDIRHDPFRLPTQGQQVVPTNVEEHASIALRDYLFAQFGNGDFADYVLNLVQIHDRFPPLILPVHGVVISRSPTMAHVIRSSGNFAHSEDGESKVLPVSISDRFIDGFGFSDALRYLYGAPLVDPNRFPSGPTPNPAGAEIERSDILEQHLDYALAYAASGHFLQVDSVTARGIDIAIRILHWETVEKALSFSLDGGLGANWKTDDSPEDRDSVSSSEDSSSRLEPSQAPPTFGIYATRLLQSIVEFLVSHFPQDFIFDATAAQLKETPRLPAVVESRPSTSNARLSKIQFGEVPVEDVALQSVRAAATLSSILISLPFPVLKVFLEHYVLGGRLGWPKVVDIMRAVIDERESRRSRVLRSRVMVADDALARNARWEESVEPSKQHQSGFRIARHRKGMDTPVSGTSSKS
ncbi:hypothetical protein EV356DRAFT_532919 [Viridothelium virens]|uniref:Uncharacterized protein n=1 Tax=Viridothelium virens TaxID=1048519 RepID=A0A6A6H972_VIRVR|nr:hypothetical protein EV356DRAFT_532919 [Viridothelium virens]